MILPALNRCVHCGLRQGNHTFSRTTFTNAILGCLSGMDSKQVAAVWVRISITWGFQTR